MLRRQSVTHFGRDGRHSHEHDVGESTYMMICSVFTKSQRPGGVVCACVKVMSVSVLYIILHLTPQEHEMKPHGILYETMQNNNNNTTQLVYIIVIRK